MSSKTKPAEEMVEILTVEDSPTQADRLKYLLEEHHYRVTVANDGKQALALLGVHKPALVISDIVMPEMNGYELCHRIKADESTQDIPVILLTSLSDPEDVLDGLACGADNFITKPYSEDYLLSHVAQILASRKLLKSEHVRIGMEILFAGKKRFITADQQQMLTLLISTYEAAVLRNSELVKAQDALSSLNEHLEDRVEERTAALSAEITVRKQAEEALRESEWNLKEAQRLGKIGHWEFDLETGRIGWSDMVFTLYGRDPKLGPPTAEEEATYYSPEDAERLHNCTRRAIETGESYEVDVRLKLPDERRAEVHAIGTPIKDAHGRVIRLLGTVQDITDRKRSEEQIRQNAALAEALAHAATRLNARLDLDAVLNAVCEETTRALNVPVAGIDLYDAQRDALDWAADFGLPSDYRQHPQTAIPRTQYEEQVQHSGPIIVLPDIQAIPNLPDAALDARTVAVAGMWREGQLVGYLNANTLGALRTFTANELALLQGLADQAAQAIVNARLFEESTRRYQNMQALHEIDRAITSSFNLHVTFNILLDQAIRRLKIDAVVLLLLNPHSQTLEYAAGRGFRTQALQHTRLQLGKSHAGRAAVERHIVSVPNLTEAPDESARTPLLANEAFVAYYAAPLIAKGHVTGVLELFHRGPLAPSQDWLEFLSALAAQASIAIDSAQLFETLQRSNADLSLAYDATVEGWSRALDLRDKETEGHTQRVTEITVRLAKAMGIGDVERVHIRRGALLHDIGKMGVPDGILLKPGKLTDEEWGVMRLHPRLAYDLLSPINYLHAALDIPYCHHEKWDGTGYPRGLKGEQIPLVARIFAIVDVWDALRSDRPYRKAWDEEKVIEHIKAGSGAHFDPNAVQAFLRLMEETLRDARE